MCDSVKRVMEVARDSLESSKLIVFPKSAYNIISVARLTECSYFPL